MCITFSITPMKLEEYCTTHIIIDKFSPKNSFLISTKIKILYCNRCLYLLVSFLPHYNQEFVDSSCDKSFF